MNRGNGLAFARALADVRRTVDRLGQLPRDLARAAAPDIALAVRAEFQNGTDPYGQPWAPLRPSTLRQHGPPPLTASGRAKDRTTVTPGRLGIVIRLGASYLAFHQVGFRVGRTKVPPRKVLPNRGLPRAWRAILNRRARELARRASR